MKKPRGNLALVLLPVRETEWCTVEWPRASIKRAIEPAKVESQLDSPATCTLPSSFHPLPLLFLSSFQSLVCHNIPANPLIAHNMLPAFHINSFKPWAPPASRKPFPPRKSPKPCSPRTQNLRRSKPCHDSFPSTLPPPKHHLPARPPAEVCVPTNADTQPCPPPSSSQFQPRDVTAPEPYTHSETPSHATASSNNSAPHISEPDMITRCGLQDNTGIPTEPPPFRGDFAGDGLSSPSISSSSDSLEELLRLSDTQDDIPIDPVILANHESWEDIDLQLSVPPAVDSIIDSEAICSYPDPPPVLHGPPGHHRDSNQRTSSQNGNTQTSDHPHIHDGQQLRASQHDASPGASYPNGAVGNHRVSGHCTGTKRKTRHSDEGARKRSRAPSPSGVDSFTALRSHFVSLPIDERLQFLSWLFEGALPRCLSDFSTTVCEAGDVRKTSRLSTSSSYGIEQDRHDCGEGKGSLRKSKKWSSEEANLLLELRGDGKRPWTEVTRLFSEQYPGRSPGAIQVYWSTTLSKKPE